MRRCSLIPLLVLAAALSGCVSNHMKQFVGKDIREVMLSEGPPINELTLADERKAFQWYWGGGTVALPGSSHTTTTGQISPSGMVAAHSTTFETPSTVYSSPGCLTTYIARNVDGAWIVEEIRYPKRLVC